MYHHHPNNMLLWTHDDAFLLTASSVWIALRFNTHYSLHHDCKFFRAQAGTVVGIDQLHEQAFAVIMYCTQFTSIDLTHNPGSVHWMQVACVTLMSILSSCPDMVYPVTDFRSSSGLFCS